jgi:hypothetical protein
VRLEVVVLVTVLVEVTVVVRDEVTVRLVVSAVVAVRVVGLVTVVLLTLTDVVVTLDVVVELDAPPTVATRTRPTSAAIATAIATSMASWRLSRCDCSSYGSGGPVGSGGRARYGGAFGS